MNSRVILRLVMRAHCSLFRVRPLLSLPCVELSLCHYRITNSRKWRSFSSALLFFRRKSATKIIAKYYKKIDKLQGKQQSSDELKSKRDAELGKDKNNMWCKGANVIDNRRRTLASKDATDQETSQTYCQSVPWSAVFFGIALSGQACVASAETTQPPPAKTSSSSSWLVAPASFKSDGVPPSKKKIYSTFNDPHTIYTLKGGAQSASLSDLIASTAAQTADCKTTLESRKKCSRRNPTSNDKVQRQVDSLVKKASSLFSLKNYYYCGNFLGNLGVTPNEKASLCAVPWCVLARICCWWCSTRANASFVIAKPAPNSRAQGSSRTWLLHFFDKYQK